MKPSEAQLAAWRRQLEGKPPQAMLAWAVDTFPGRLVFATSLGPEDQVLTHMLATAHLPIPIFTLDTGRLFPETYSLLETTEKHYGKRIEVFFPDQTEVEAMVHEHGVNLFRKSVELRRHCCGVRKLAPLRRALAGKAAWIVGLRRAQSLTRQELSTLQWDDANGLVKLSPLADWSESDVWDFIRNHRIPYNPLHDQGYPSIGCACCTRAVLPGEDPRAGRWWWERAEHRECGLHTTPVVAQRAAPAPPPVITQRAARPRATLARHAAQRRTDDARHAAQLRRGRS